MVWVLLRLLACTAVVPGEPPDLSASDPAAVSPDSLASGTAEVTEEECEQPLATRPALVAYSADQVGVFRILWAPGFDAAPALRALVREALVEDLATLAERVPRPALDRLAGTQIAVDVEAADDRGDRLHGLATHQSAGWLVTHGLDGAREGVVEVYDARDYLRYRATTQPMVILHELTHVLGRTADAPTLDALAVAYRGAVDSTRYEAVRHVGGRGGDTERAYALKNEAEYAAELSEALFGRNDFYPFDQTELQSFDPAGCESVAQLWLAACPRP